MKFLPQFGLIESSGAGDHGSVLLYSDKESLIAAPTQFSEGKSGYPSLFMDRTLLEESSCAPTVLFLIGLMELKGDKLSVLCGDCESGAPLPEGWVWISFGDLFRSMDKEDQIPFSRAKQILGWERSHRFCGSCGTETEPLSHEPCRRCPACGEMFYPRFSPAVIVRITRGRQIMLAHNGRFPENLYANIAGFLEAGESLEEAVRREIREEVSLEVENIRYFDSQQWPMPHSLMLGFTAECPEDKPAPIPVPDGEEITDAQWFDPENLPELPPPGSIARRMIDDFLGKLV